MRLCRVGLALAALAVLLAVPGLASAQTCNLGATTCTGTPACAAPCPNPVSVSSATAGTCTTGHSFNLIGTAYENTCVGGIVGSCATQCPTAGSVPPVRFWSYNNYAKANSGCANRCQQQWIINSKIDLGIGPANGHWVLFGGDWSHPMVDGCVGASGTTVAEISDITGTGTPGHGAWYVINSAPGGGTYDFDQVSGAAGGCGAKDFIQRPVSPVTLPARTGACTGAPATQISTSNANAAFFDVQVMLTTPVPTWNTQNGANGDAAGANTPLIAGYQIVYAKGAEPTTSNYFAGNWQPALSQANPTMASATFALPIANPVTVSLPKGTPGTDQYWLAARVVYQDTSLNQLGAFDPATANAGPDVTSPVGGHCGPVTFQGGIVTAVVFTDVRAVRNGSSVLVSWSTALEDDVLGFRVFRSSSPSGVDAEAADRNQPVVARGANSLYGQTDSAAPRATTYYYVQEITSNGLGMKSDVIRVDGLSTGSTSRGGRSRGRR